MEPRYLTYVVATYFVVVGNRGSSDVDRLRSGDDIFVSVVTQLGVTRPCVGRDLTVTLVSRDVPPEAIPCGSRKFLGLTICWKSKETIRSCTVLVVEPAI